MYGAAAAAFGRSRIAGARHGFGTLNLSLNDALPSGLNGTGSVAATTMPLQTRLATSDGSGFGGVFPGMTSPKTLIRTSPLRLTRIELCRLATHGLPPGLMPNSMTPSPFGGSGVEPA